MKKRIFFLTILTGLLCLAVNNLKANSGDSTTLPRVHIIATGGTIAGAGGSSTDAQYQPGQVGIGSIVSAVPELGKIARISTEQLYNIASQDMTDEHWLRLAKRVNELLAKDDTDAVVITHGTDVMEETAYFLQLAAKSDKPIILVGSMRPSTSMSADGPMNLFGAVRVAGDPATKGQGVLIVMNGKILNATEASKFNTIKVETFESPNTGALGEINGEDITYRHKSLKKHTTETPFSVETLTELPRVGIIYGHAGIGPEAVEAMIKAGYKGIVYAGVGNGNIRKELIPILEKAAKQGIAVVRSTRIPTGPVTLNGEVDDKALGFVSAFDLSPQKARILLMLALANGYTSREQLQQFFLEY